MSPMLPRLFPRLKRRESGTPRAQTTPESQPRKTEDDAEDDEVALLHIPGSFDFGDSAARGACVGSFDSFGVVDTLGNLWRWMQLRSLR
jgi:hypothetical protein